jgi:tryptophan halogenase
MVKNIVIVGGGSAGWMTAAHMSSHLTDVNITLIESPDVPTVGVGESTVPPVRDFMEALGFKEEDWMAKCNATYKSAICFSGFNNIHSQKFWYPFSRTWQVDNIYANQYWLYKHLTDKAYKDRFSLYEYTSLVPNICESGKTVKSIPGTGYAYHFDAAALGSVLKDFSLTNNVEHILGTISGVVANDNGTIKQVILTNGEAVNGDLFIDCSGFRSLLLGQHYNEPFNDYYDYLFNDSAVTIQLPYRDKDSEMFSYTLCTALSAGWVWTIPLYNRISRGYVYCSKYLSKDQAEAELREHIGESRADGVRASHIDIKVGKYRRTWVNNCVAIGLSSGFIEPLESTGLQIVQGEIDLLTRTLKNENDYNCADIAVFNSCVTKLIDNIRDFLVCHYALTSREDTPYWHDVKYNTKIPDSLTEKLITARSIIPSLTSELSFDTGKLAGFSFSEGWYNILVGMGHLPFDYEQHKKAGIGAYDRRIANSINSADNFYAQVKNQRKKISSMPGHYQFLKNNIYQGKS